MPDKAMAKRHLAQADRHIAKGEQRLAEQREIAEALAAGGHNDAAVRAAALATTMQHTLDIMREHRQLILRELAAEVPAG
jgi:hypothetical protein